MATVNLFLKNPNANKTAIRAIISDGRDFNFKFYSGISINPKHWSKKGRYVLSADSDSVVLNKNLQEFRRRVLNAYLSAKFEGVKVTTEYLKEEVWPNVEEKLNFWQVWDLYLQSKRGEFKPHTYTKFNSLRGHLEKFEIHMKKPFKLDLIDKVALHDLQNFMWYERQLNTQSTDKYIGVFKMFLSWASEHGYLNNQGYKNFKSVKQPDSLKVIIANEEMNRIREIDFGDKNYLSNARELFILSCKTGLRFSDYSRVQKQHLKVDGDGSPILVIRQQKTDDFVEIPLDNEGFQIVQRLVEGELHSISNQKMNNYVKELCRLAKVDEPFEIHKFKGKEKEVTIRPKFELITTHTGRRTFASSLLEKGVPAETVMYFTGHRDYKSFSKYVNIPKASKKNAVKAALLEDLIMKVAN